MYSVGPVLSITNQFPIPYATLCRLEFIARIEDIVYDE